jgi:hypothetical protein
MWKKVEEDLPKHGQIIFVKVKIKQSNCIYHAVAEYSKYDGFSAEISAYDIVALDDSGLDVTFDGDVIFWMDIPV